MCIFFCILRDGVCFNHSIIGQLLSFLLLVTVVCAKLYLSFHCVAVACCGTCISLQDNFLSMLTDKFQVSYVSAEMTVLWLGLQLGVVFLQVGEEEEEEEENSFQ